MIERTFRAMGTEWFLSADGCGGVALDRAQQHVLREERRFSRFRPNSALSRLNRERSLRDPVVAAVMRKSLQFRRWTKGAFDPTVGGDVITAGYSRSFEEIAGQELQVTGIVSEHPDISVMGDRVELRGGGFVDLGGLVKGWTVDRVSRLLVEAGACSYLVDGGGDIRIGMPFAGREEWAIGAGNGHVLRLTSGAVATSSSLVRTWQTDRGKAHHIITPASGEAASGPFVTAAVIAPDAMSADVLATALIADASRALPLLPRFHAEALLESRDGQWVMTPGIQKWLN